MTMRFGGHIAAAACIAVFAGAAAAQNAGSGAQDAPAAEQGTPSPDRLGENQPDRTGRQDRNQPNQKGGKTKQQGPKQPAADRKPTPVEEYEQKVRSYDPLANDDNRQAEGEGKAGSSAQPEGQTPTVPTRSAEPAGTALPGPTVGGDADTGYLSQYSGPPVLSRSYTILRPLVPTQERWIPLVGVNGIYDSGMNGFQATPNGPPERGGSEGAEVFWGLSGRHYFHRDIFGVNYRGDMQYYTPAKAYDGSNHWLTLDYTHAFSRRIWMTLVEAGTVYSQNYTLENPVAVSNESVASVNLATTPNVQVFDNGLQQVTTSADVTWQKSARLSFDAGGSWFAVHRNAAYLLGAYGDQGRADALYRLNRRMTAGVSYGYNEYWFPHNAGGARFNNFDAIYSWAISGSLQLRARGGASRLNSYGLTTIFLPTSLSSVLGQNNAIVGYRSLQWVSDYSVQVIKGFRRSRSASISYARGVTPGNGLYLTSVNQDATASGSMLLMRHYYVSTGAGYDSLRAASQYIGSYSSYFAFFGISRSLRRGVQSNLRFDYRHFTITNQPFLRNEYRVTLGFSWSPVEGLFRLW